MRLSILNGVFSAAYASGSALGGVLYRLNMCSSLNFTINAKICIYLRAYENYYVNFTTSVCLAVLGIGLSSSIKESVKVEAIFNSGFCFKIDGFVKLFRESHTR